MKLLYDQNLSPRLPKLLADIYPESLHVRSLSMQESTDSQIWEYAKAHEFSIVSKDADFQARSLLFGHPPKFIWLRVGNCPVQTIETLLRKYSVAIHTFELNEMQSHILIP